MATTRAALISICHGGGPMPALEDPAHKALIKSLREDVPKLLKLGTEQAPKAIAILTAHWQTETPTISSGKTHPLYYDYYGFPSEAYNIKYDVEGAPDVAQRAHALFEQHGIKVELDGERGFDHGTFIPMKLINPDASIPIVQLSVLASQNATDLLSMGRALSQLREENVAIIGSGSPSYHNLRDWLSGRTQFDKSFPERQAQWNDAIEAALEAKDEKTRTAALADWRKFPHAFEMHPPRAAEHFSTLLACAGAAKDAKVHCSRVSLMGADQHMCWWD